VIVQAEGYVIGSSIKSIPIAGRDITYFVQSLLRDRGEPDSSLKTAEQIKEELCYVCPDIVKEFTRFDREPERFQKYVVEQLGGKKVTVDVGYERFLAPEIFFNPEIYSSDFLTPLPNVVDNVIQSSPIDVRRGLYKVCPPTSLKCGGASAYCDRTLSFLVVQPYTKISAVVSSAISATSSTIVYVPLRHVPAAPNPVASKCKSSRTSGNVTVHGSEAACWVRRPSSGATVTLRRSTTKLDRALLGGSHCWVARARNVYVGGARYLDYLHVVFWEVVDA
jgi:hypothetical protein